MGKYFASSLFQPSPNHTTSFYAMSTQVQAHMGDGDQRPHDVSNIAHTTNEFQAAPHLSHKLPDMKDERTLDNRVHAEQLQEKIEKQQDQQHEQEMKHPTRAALNHGNEPSKGAKVDEDLAKDDEAALKKKGLA